VQVFALAPAISRSTKAYGHKVTPESRPSKFKYRLVAALALKGWYSHSGLVGSSDPGDRRNRHLNYPGFPPAFLAIGAISER
jgi:hypothetical protein